MKMKDSNLEWLKSRGFRKERGADEWRLCVKDDDEAYEAPMFAVRAVRGPNGLWHARVAVDRPCGAQEINFIMLSGGLVKEGVPEDWEEPLFVYLGSSLCAKSAEEAVTTAVQRAACFIGTMDSNKWYNIRCLKDDMLGDGK